MPEFLSTKISGWGNLGFADVQAIRPDSTSEVRRQVRDMNGHPVIARGLGRSYGDSSVNDGGVVLLNESLNRVLAFDSATGLLTCESGVCFEDIIDTFLPRGFFLPVTPGTKFVTLGGAIAADVHGKNHHLEGSIGNFIERFSLFTGHGETLECSRDENADAFWATLGGMGLTGIILDASIRLQPVESAYIMADNIRVPNLKAGFDLLLSEAESCKYSVAWIDCLAQGDSLGRAVLIQGSHATREQLTTKQAADPFNIGSKRTKSVPFNFPSFALNSLSIKAFNAIYYAKNKTVTGQIAHYNPFFYPLDSVHHWNRIYGKRGFVQYQALFPPESASEGVTQLLQAIADSKMASFLAVLKRTGAQDEGHLSFCKPGFTLALDMPNYGAPLRKVIERLDRIVLDFDGRLYLAKDAVMSPATFARMYPRLEEFRAICKRLDPDGRFSSSQSRRLEILG